MSLFMFVLNLEVNSHLEALEVEQPSNDEPPNYTGTYTLDVLSSSDAPTVLRDRIANHVANYLTY